VVIGASSNKAPRFCAEGEDVVKLSTMDEGFEVFLGTFAVPSVIFGVSGLSSLEPSGENDGKDVRLLSDEAIDDAELEI
jgi:hypothetical protein